MKHYEIKAEFAHRPAAPTVTPLPNGNAVVSFYEVVEIIPATEETEARYICNIFSMETRNANDLESRVNANVEAWKEKAVAAAREECAAAVRAARDALLAASDQRMTLDRGLNLKLPDTVTAATLLTAFKDIITGFKDALSGDWAKYRQALRDLTTQEGFPFNVIWPSAPTSNE